MDEVELRLSAISVVNQFNNDVATVHRPQKDGIVGPKHKDIVITCNEPEPLPELDRPGNPPAEAFVLTIDVNGVLMPDKDDITPFDELAASFGADMRNAIANATDWHQFDGNCMDARRSGLTTVKADDDGPGGVRFTIRAFYRVSELDHNVLRN